MVQSAVCDAGETLAGVLPDVPSFQSFTIRCQRLTGTLHHILRASDNMGARVEAVSTGSFGSSHAIRLRLEGLDVRGGEQLCRYVRSLPAVEFCALEHVLARR